MGSNSPETVCSLDVFGPSPGPYPNRHGRKGNEGKGDTKELNQYSGNQKPGCPAEQALGKLGTQTSCESDVHIDGWKAGGR